MTIKAQKYTFHCRFKTQARLPGFLGSTLRGALGWALKKTSCALRRQQCNGCLLREQCAYAWIFATEQYRVGTGRTVNARPHPFVLHPGTMRGVQEAGHTFSFSLLLFDRAIELLPHIVYAVQLMGESGIGTGRRQGLGRFVLRKITAGQGKKEIIYQSEEAVLHQLKTIPKIQLDNKAMNGVQSVKVLMQTPLRVKQRNTLQRRLDFHILIRAAFRRVAALEDAYGNGEPDIDYQGMVKRAELVATRQSDIHWQQINRWSNRQRAKTSLSGLIGTIAYTGSLGEFIPILRYCEQVNVGKQTVFGLGRIHIEYHQEVCNG